MTTSLSAGISHIYIIHPVWQLIEDVVEHQLLQQRARMPQTRSPHLQLFEFGLDVLMNH